MFFFASKFRDFCFKVVKLNCVLTFHLPSYFLCEFELKDKCDKLIPRTFLLILVPMLEFDAAFWHAFWPYHHIFDYTNPPIMIGGYLLVSKWGVVLCMLHLHCFLEGFGALATNNYNCIRKGFSPYEAVLVRNDKRQH